MPPPTPSMRLPFLYPRFSSLTSSRTFQRTLTTTSPPSASTTPNPPATSTSAAQPFSTPLTPSPKNTPGLSTSKSKTPPPPKSSCAEGTTLRGLNYLKTGPNYIAKPDPEYPSWLWTLLDKKSGEAEDGSAGEGDAFAKSAKQRKKAAKAERARMGGGGEGVEVKRVRLDEQSLDLAVEGEEGRKERQAVTKAMRETRRKGIREANFLRGMR